MNDPHGQRFQIMQNEAEVQQRRRPPPLVMPGLEPGIQAAPLADYHADVGPGCTGQARA